MTAIALPRLRRRAWRPKPPWWWWCLAICVFDAGCVVYGVHRVTTADNGLTVAVWTLLVVIYACGVVVNVRMLRHTGSRNPLLDPGMTERNAPLLLTMLACGAALMSLFGLQILGLA